MVPEAWEVEVVENGMTQAPDRCIVGMVRVKERLQKLGWVEDGNAMGVCEGLAMSH